MWQSNVLSTFFLALQSCSLSLLNVCWPPLTCLLKFKKECLNCFWFFAWVFIWHFSQLVMSYNSCISWMICLWFSASSLFPWTDLNTWYLSLSCDVSFLANFWLTLTGFTRKSLRLLWYAATSHLSKYSSFCSTMLNGILLLRSLLTFWFILIFYLLFKLSYSVLLMLPLVWSPLLSSVSLTHILVFLLSMITVAWITVSLTNFGAADCWLEVLSTENCVIL